MQCKWRSIEKVRGRSLAGNRKASHHGKKSPAEAKAPYAHVIIGSVEHREREHVSRISRASAESTWLEKVTKGLSVKFYSTLWRTIPEVRTCGGKRNNTIRTWHQEHYDRVSVRTCQLSTTLATCVTVIKQPGNGVPGGVAITVFETAIDAATLI